ncbi:MAG: hypothetical protein ACMVY4_05350 [Minwuia sp.]|uniref:hypothetical protein n=1 Tax=Minwuia sp. TaxID=2493630 RepID=UPI003A87EAA1
MLDDGQRAAFARIADALIPAVQGMPSFSQSDADPVHLDRVLTLRPELLAPLQAALEKAAAGMDAEALNRDHPEAIGVIGLVASSAYYLSPDIRRRLGYPGQIQRPAAEEEEHDYADLLQPVIDRGRIYREV